MAVTEDDYTCPLADLATAAAALAMPEWEDRIQEMIAVAFLRGKAVGEVLGEGTETFHGLGLEPHDEKDIETAERLVGN